MNRNGDTMRRLGCVLGLVIFFTLGATSWTQLSEAQRWAAEVENAYEVEPNVTYLVANNYEAKLDVYYRPGAKAPVPVVMTIHGGGWIEGTKEASILGALPFLHMGFPVVNLVERLGKGSSPPPAVGECFCGLHQVGRNTPQYHLD